MEMEKIIKILIEITADRKSDQAKIDADREQMLARMDAKMDANKAKATKKEEMLAEISARMETNLNEICEEIKSGQVEKIHTFCIPV
jgi:DNA anti-recombination protein RmuC